MIQYAGVYGFRPVFLALIPIPAAANAGVGFFTLPWPVVFLALIPVIGLEGCVLAWMLRLPWRRAFSLALVANLNSTLYGLGLSYGLDIVLLGFTGSSGFEPTKTLVSVMLIPFFALSWWIEGLVVRRQARECSKAAVAWAVGVANLLSYGAVIAYVQLTPFVPEIAPSQSTRTILYDGFRAAQALEPRVEAFWAVHRRFPADASELGNVGEPYDTSREFGVRLEADGRIVLRFHAPHHRYLDGKQIRLTPTPPGAPEGGRLEWRCRSPDLRPELLKLLARLRAQCSPE
jgi:hypothetical protein